MILYGWDLTVPGSWLTGIGLWNPDGEAADKIRGWIEEKGAEDVPVTGCVLWGVGNHGGGPSRKDLEQNGELMREEKGESILSGSSIRPVEDRALQTLDYGLEIVGKWKRQAFLLCLPGSGKRREA
ncbi:MAG TPA: hypothetical protein DCZ91_06395 [Lachnospiraceae bacterium]|nr:hypothetical protein [Lachnospiraceae bacterium]